MVIKLKVYNGNVGEVGFLLPAWYLLNTYEPLTY